MLQAHPAFAALKQQKRAEFVGGKAIGQRAALSGPGPREPRNRRPLEASLDSGETIRRSLNLQILTTAQPRRAGRNEQCELSGRR